MLSTLIIGLLGGLITGISPCILPILPLVLAVSSGDDGPATRVVKARPWLVIAGLVTSFTAVTLFATTLLNALGLPSDIVWKVGIGMLFIVGLGMIFPRVQEIVEWPFLQLPRASGLQSAVRDKGGFVVGLALGVVFVPCAGPVLAAITVAGSTGRVDGRIILLSLAFAIGVAIPLLVFALGGQEISKRVDFFQRHQRVFRRSAGVVVLVMTVAIASGAPEWLQRQLPSVDQSQLVTADLRATGAQENGELIPKYTGLGMWFNTDAPVDPRTNGKVTLTDFWAYACINCQRNNVHITALYEHYKDYGFEVVGIHTPEYAFEHDADNLQRAMKEQNITYPVAQDNDFATWQAFGNRYWPAHYLSDAAGQLREVHEGEGDYAQTEQTIRELLLQRDPQVKLPAPLRDPGTSSTRGRSTETYLGTDRARFFNNDDYSPGTHTYTPRDPQPGTYTLRGEWTLKDQPIIAGHDAGLRLNFRAAWVQVVVAGRGKITAHYADGTSREFPVTKDGTIDLIRGGEAREEILDLDVSEGVELYSFTFG